METSRDDVGIAIRSAFLSRGTQQRFSLIVLIFISVGLIFLESIEAKPLNHFRSLFKDFIYRGSVLVSYPTKIFSSVIATTKKHVVIYENYNELEKENNELRSQISKVDFLTLENTQLRKLIDEQVKSSSNLVSSRVMLDKQSPYLNSFIINTGANKQIKNGLAALDGKNFIGRVVDVNFFSSRVLLITDLNSKIPIISEPSGNHAILSGNGSGMPILQYLPKNNKVETGDKIYTSGKEGIFGPGIPIGTAVKKGEEINVSLFSDLSQITFVNIDLGVIDTTNR